MRVSIGVGRRCLESIRLLQQGDVVSSISARVLIGDVQPFRMKHIVTLLSRRIRDVAASMKWSAFCVLNSVIGYFVDDWVENSLVE
jgi:hypothetical protein